MPRFAITVSPIGPDTFVGIELDADALAAAIEECMMGQILTVDDAQVQLVNVEVEPIDGE